MSAKNRGSIVEENEHYGTPHWCIEEFWKSFSEREGVDIKQLSSILDPCAGGSDKHECPYPAVLSKFISEDSQIGMFPFFTVDIRPESRATYKEDYFSRSFGVHDMIISNPPFSLFEQFVEKGYDEVLDGGYVIFLLRVGVLGGQDRNYERKFWERFPAKYQFVTPRRPSFIKGGSDSSEYAHFVWQKGFTGDLTTIIVKGISTKSKKENKQIDLFV